MNWKVRYYNVKLYINGEKSNVFVTYMAMPIFVKLVIQIHLNGKFDGLTSKIFYCKRAKTYSFFQRYKWYWHLKSAIIDSKDSFRKKIQLYTNFVTNSAINSLPRRYE